MFGELWARQTNKRRPFHSPPFFLRKGQRTMTFLKWKYLHVSYEYYYCNNFHCMRHIHLREFSYKWVFAEPVNDQEVWFVTYWENVWRYGLPGARWCGIGEQRFLALLVLIFLAHLTWLAHPFNLLVEINPVNRVVCQALGFTDPLGWWPVCSCCRMSAFILAGMRICRPLQMTPDSVHSSSRNAQYGRRSTGSSLMVAGHPAWITCFSSCKTGSRAASSRELLLLFGSEVDKADIDMIHVQVK